MEKLTKKGKILEFSVALLFILIGVSLRLLPHPPNFAPIAALALFGGVYLSRKIAFILPMAAMMISDIFIGYYEFGLMIFVYGSFLNLVNRSGKALGVAVEGRAGTLKIQRFQRIFLVVSMIFMAEPEI